MNYNDITQFSTHDRDVLLKIIAVANITLSYLRASSEEGWGNVKNVTNQLLDPEMLNC